jgi:hypothetical protein
MWNMTKEIRTRLACLCVFVAYNSLLVDQRGYTHYDSWLDYPLALLTDVFLVY